MIFFFHSPQGLFKCCGYFRYLVFGSGAAKMQLEYLKLINSLFCEVNPVPVKTAMAELGWCNIDMRLPLCEMEDANKAKLLGAMKEKGLI